MKAFREARIPGAAYVLGEAVRRGFTAGDLSWCNLGQGQPEAGLLAGSPQPIRSLALQEDDHPYGPVSGLLELRQAIASYYNRLYRAGYASQYTADNVAVCGGGRVALARTIAALGSVRLGYRTPDYMSFEDLLAQHRPRLEPIPLRVGADMGFSLRAGQLRSTIVEHACDAMLLSNPCNPTGQLITGNELRECVRVAVEYDCALVLDEFYSHYVYDDAGGAAAGPVSAARYVENVDRDPVILIDGVTKNLRRPGWRLGWVVGPAAVVEQIGRKGTVLDGGPSTLVQHAAVPMLSASYVDSEGAAIRKVFAQKRRVMVDGLRKIGVKILAEPRGAFYVWGDVSRLPGILAEGEGFFSAALDQKVIVVPGRFFDLNPGGSGQQPSSSRSYLRFSFGPKLACVEEGMHRLETLIRRGV